MLQHQTVRVLGALLLALATSTPMLAHSQQEEPQLEELPLEPGPAPVEDLPLLPLPPPEGEDDSELPPLELPQPKPPKPKRSPSPSPAPGAPLPLPKEEEEVRLQPTPSGEQAPAPTEPTSSGGLVGPLTPDFVLYRHPELGSWIKPVVRIATGVVTYVPTLRQNPRLATRVSTLLLGRMGVEGEILPTVGFKIALERSLGFTYDVQGPGGTSVWEGQGEFQPREMYLRLSRWGFTVTGGIVRDYDTFDFYSEHTDDFFGMDPFIRGPMLASGLSEGQGAMVKYEWHGIRVGFSYTGGSPQVTSVAGGFGGVQRILPNDVEAPLDPLGALSAPTTPMHLQVFSPTLSYDHPYVDVRTAAQVLLVDPDLTRDGPQLTGYNLRATARVKLFAESLVMFGGFSYRQNDQLDASVGAFEGVVGSIGADYTWQNTVGVGGSFVYVEQYPRPDVMVRFRYVNAAATYWIFPDLVAVGVRYSRVMPGKRGADVDLLTADSVMVTARLKI